MCVSLVKMRRSVFESGWTYRVQRCFLFSASVAHARHCFEASCDRTSERGPTIHIFVCYGPVVWLSPSSQPNRPTDHPTVHPSISLFIDLVTGTLLSRWLLFRAWTADGRKDGQTDGGRQAGRRKDERTVVVNYRNEGIFLPMFCRTRVSIVDVVW